MYTHYKVGLPNAHQARQKAHCLLYSLNRRHWLRDRKWCSLSWGAFLVSVHNAYISILDAPTGMVQGTDLLDAPFAFGLPPLACGLRRVIIFCFLMWRNETYLL
jgi:hypothetical protein